MNEVELMRVKSHMLSMYYFIGDMLKSSKSSKLSEEQRRNWERMRYTLHYGYKYICLMQEMRDIAIANSGHLSKEVERLNTSLQRAVTELSSI